MLSTRRGTCYVEQSIRMSWWHMLQAILSYIHSTLEALPACSARERDATDETSKQPNIRAAGWNQRFAEHHFHGT